MKILRLLVIPAVLFQFTACSEKKETIGEKVPAVKAEFEKLCSSCHSVDIVLSRNKTLDGWRQTVDRMRKKGMEITDAKASEVAEYLFSVRGTR